MRLTIIITVGPNYCTRSTLELLFVLVVLDVEKIDSQRRPIRQQQVRDDESQAKRAMKNGKSLLVHNLM